MNHLLSVVYFKTIERNNGKLKVKNKVSYCEFKCISVIDSILGIECFTICIFPFPFTNVFENKKNITVVELTNLIAVKIKFDF